MKIVLFRTDWSSLFSIVISIVTKENYSHAALLLDDGLYDASEKRRSGAGFGGYMSKYGSRLCDVFDVDVSKYPTPTGKDPIELTNAVISKYIEKTQGTPYDWTGVFGWLFNKENPRKLYCYEYICGALESVGYNVHPMYRHRASHIKQILNSKPIYTGPADQYNEEEIDAI